MVTIFGIVALLISGALCASKPVEFRARLALATLLGAVALETLLLIALSNARLEAMLRETVYGTIGNLGLFAAAAIEVAGLWVPLVIVPWASRRARAMSGLAVYAASVFGASGYYFPFDIVELNGQVVSPSRLE